MSYPLAFLGFYKNFCVFLMIFKLDPSSILPLISLVISIIGIVNFLVSMKIIQKRLSKLKEINANIFESGGPLQLLKTLSWRKKITLKLSSMLAQKRSKSMSK